MDADEVDVGLGCLFFIALMGILLTIIIGVMFYGITRVG